VFAIEIENGQKIFPMHPAGHTRDCRQRICYRHTAARDFAFVDVSVARGPRYGSSQKINIQLDGQPRYVNHAHNPIDYSRASIDRSLPHLAI
jgi:hypothetical protein